MSGAVLFASCSSSTLIETNPVGAKLYLDGEPVGTTPYTHSDTKIVGSSTNIRLEKAGYEPLNVAMSRNEQVDVGAIIGGLFVWVPFLWIMKYKPVHRYEMVPLSGNASYQQERAITLTGSKADKLKELKELLDQNILTKEEFEIEKAKVLAE